MSRFLGVLTCVAASLALTSTAGADILYAKGKGIWRVPASGKGKPRKVIALDVDGGKVSRIEKTTNTRFVLLEIDGVAAFAKLGKKPARPQPLECDRDPQLSPDGLCVACLDSKGRLVIHVLASGKKRVLDKVVPTGYGFASRTRLAVARTRSISFASVATGKHIKKVASFAPSSNLLVSPNGKRAVGDFEGEKKGDTTVSTLYIFKLDGKAARRKLGTGGVPTKWSRDSRWVVTQTGERTCVIRATGGQYKCWDGYTGLALSPDNKQFLMSQKTGKSHTLFKVSMAGARPAKPVVWKKVDAPVALWTPAPQKKSTAGGDENQKSKTGRNAQ